MEKTLREQAIKWWNQLSEDTQGELFNGYHKFTTANSANQLTGREVQNIWAVQMNPPDPAPPTSSDGVENESLEEKINRYQKMYEAHDNEYCNSHEIQDLKESYYYKGRRDQCINFKTQDKALIAELLEALKYVK